MMEIPKVGTKIKVIDAGSGARACNGHIGIVTDEMNDGGLFATSEGYNVKIVNSDGEDCIYRVNIDATFEIIEKSNDVQKKIDMNNIDMEIRKHEIIAHRLKNIKDMEQILQGNSKDYQKYLNDKTFLNGVRYRLNIEKELLKDLYKM